MAPLALGTAIVAVPALVLLMASAGPASRGGSAAVADTVAAKAQTDRAARVTFRVRAGSLGLRILRDAPAPTRAIRGRALHVICGSVGGLESARVRWPEGADAVAVRLAVSPARTEFCRLKRGRQVVAHAVLG